MVDSLGAPLCSLKENCLPYLFTNFCILSVMGFFTGLHVDASGRHSTASLTPKYYLLSCNKDYFRGWK